MVSIIFVHHRLFWQNLPDDTEIQKRILYYRQVLQETREANKAAANKSKKQFEKRHKTKVFEPREPVFVDLGKRTKVKKVINKVPAVIVQGFAGSQYRVVWLSGVKEGQLEVVAVDRLEPFYVRQDSAHMENINKFRDNIDNNQYDLSLPAAPKGQKRKRVEDLGSPPTKKQCQATSTKTLTTEGTHAPEAKKLQEKPSVAEKRSESHFWKLACSGEVLAPRELQRKSKGINDMVF